jgi:NADH dehydrogenase FAD-containing subunit
VIIINPESVKNNLDAVLKVAEDVSKESNTLFIIGDCANLHDAKKKVSELCHLAFSGRHYS